MLFDPILDLFRGQAVTIPPLDGAFRPNTELDDAALLAELSEPDNLAPTPDGLLASSGNALYRLSAEGAPQKAETYSSPVSAFAVSPSGELAVGLETGELLLSGRRLDPPAPFTCITALAFSPVGTLWIANGSARYAPSLWTADLMEKNSSGSIWRLSGDGQFDRLADGLAYPYGLLVDGDGLYVSESWRHRLLRIDTADGTRSVVSDKIAGYPSRLAPAAGGGAWLSVFAPRNRLIEFILQETHYRADMMELVPPPYWIAPSLSSRRSFLEPLQCGGIKTMGLHKPWAPSRSCGMVVRLDARMMPQTSMHSRADGNRHGTTCAVEFNGRLAIASKGGDCVIAAAIPSSGAIRAVEER